MLQSKEEMCSIAKSFQRDYLFLTIFPIVIFLVTVGIGIKYFVSHLSLLFTSMTFLSIVVILFYIYVLYRHTVTRYIKPVEKLYKAAANVYGNNIDFDCPDKLLDRKDEVGALARAFAGISEHMQELFSNLEQRLAEYKEVIIAKQKSESHYENLFNSVPIGLYRSNPDGKLIESNRALIGMLGFSPEQFCFNSTDQQILTRIRADQFYVDPKERTAWLKQMEMSDGVYICEKQFRRLDGTIIWVEDQAHTLRDYEGRIVCFEGSMKDITERKKNEIALKENERKYKVLYEESKRVQQVYKSLIHSSADALVISELNGKTQYVSPVFTKWFGWTLEELEGKQIAFVPISEKAQTDAIVEDLVENGKPCHGFVTKRFTKDGGVIDVSISASRFDDHQGNPAGILTNIRDISEKSKLEAQLQHVERMEAIGTLAGGIAHDFNNLMMGMQGHISLMLCNINHNHPHYSKLKSIEAMIESGAKLTRHLLGYARKGKYEAHPMDINELLLQTSETFGRTRKAITIHTDLANRIGAIEADRTQIEQVFMNLYINAGDAMPDGGDLFLKTRMLTEDQFGKKQYVPKPGSYVLLTVTDTGEGIEPQYINRVFDPFFTTKEMDRGTGLGLASVYGIVKAHGGYIDVNSTLGEGTVFKVYLPTMEQITSLNFKKGMQLGQGRGTILIVDDEAIVIEVCGDMLRKAGYSVESATNGQEAVSRYKELSDEIDLVILDMVMPRMGGGEVFDQIKAIRPNAKVILASGYSIDGQAAKILKRGCSGFIQKPFSLQQLTCKIEDILATS